jgi:hypothetical protein
VAQEEEDVLMMVRATLTQGVVTVSRSDAAVVLFGGDVAAAGPIIALWRRCLEAMWRWCRKSESRRSSCSWGSQRSARIRRFGSLALAR